jgi:hypothetical protein
MIDKLTTADYYYYYLLSRFELVTSLLSDWSPFRKKNKKKTFVLKVTLIKVMVLLGGFCCICQ